MLLGELEKLVLNYFWSVPQADAKQTHAHFSEQRGGSLNTIQSTLDRLYKKGLLHREKQGHAYIYSVACSRREFIGQLVRSVTEDFVQPGEDNLLAAFVSLSTELDEKQLANLEATIREYESKQENEETRQQPDQEK